MEVWEDGDLQLSICCSRRSGAVVGGFVDRLRRNLAVESLLIAEDDVPVSETWEEGSGADALLILLDSVSAPAPLRVSDWTALMQPGGEPPVGFVALEECAFPLVLRRRLFFPASGWERAAERWVAGLMPSCDGIAPVACDAPYPEEWWALLADSPGQVSTSDPDAAQAFAHRAAGHFQGVAWIGCAGREPALIQAEMDFRLAQGRMLAVLAYPDRPVRVRDGRHSYIQISGPAPAFGACYGPIFPGWLAKALGSDLSLATALDSRRGFYRVAAAVDCDDSLRQRHLQILHERFTDWKADPEPCRELLGELNGALAFGFAHDWERARELGRRGAFVLLGQGRRREGIRLLHRLLLAAEEYSDAETAEEARHELSWLTDDDEPVRTRPAEAVQLGFGF